MLGNALTDSPILNSNKNCDRHAFILRLLVPLGPAQLPTIQTQKYLLIMGRKTVFGVFGREITGLQFDPSCVEPLLTHFLKLGN
jgi:hypothetical protein